MGNQEPEIEKLPQDEAPGREPEKKKLKLSTAGDETESPAAVTGGSGGADLSTSKTEGGSAKRRKCDDSAQSSNSHAFETTTGEDEQGSTALTDFQSMWNIKKEDLVVRERLSKMRLLNSLIAKQELAEYEEALKKKLINEFLSN